MTGEVKDDACCENIKVLARVRPLLPAEQEKGRGEIVVTTRGANEVLVGEEDGAKTAFTYDSAVGGSGTQGEVYTSGVSNVVQSVLKGYNGAVIAYGQTGSGKTHTMSGTRSDPGLIQRMVQDIFYSIAAKHAEGPTEYYRVKASFVQLYNEQVYDMLQTKTVGLSMNRGIDDVLNVSVGNWREMSKLIRVADANRVVHYTEMNDASSRSHAAFILTLSCENRSTGLERLSQLYMVDLAGSECVEKTKSAGGTLDEAKSINKSLLSLRRVITALVDDAPHIPYRDSLLTRLLAGALGGNSRTCLVVCVAPTAYNKSESLSTLRFGMYTGSVTNIAVKAVVQNTKVLEAELQKLQGDISVLATLKRKLQRLASEQPLGNVDDSLSQSKQMVFPPALAAAPTASVSAVCPAPALTPAARCATPATNVPKEFICPLSGLLMADPVTLADGFTYERAEADKYLLRKGVPPKAPCASVPVVYHKHAVPNKVLHSLIDAFVHAARPEAVSNGPLQDIPPASLA